MGEFYDYRKIVRGKIFILEKVRRGDIFEDFWDIFFLGEYYNK